MPVGIVLATMVLLFFNNKPNIYTELQMLGSFVSFPVPKAEWAISLCLFVCLFIGEPDHGKSIQSIFMKPCSIMDHWGKNQLDLGVDPSQNGRVAAILDFR